MFSHYSRFVMQRDPLSTTLFILVALFEDWRYIDYGMPKWSSNINHLAYEDDTITLVYTKQGSFEMIIKLLQEYEVASDQMFNKEKCYLNMFSKTSQETVYEIKNNRF